MTVMKHRHVVPPTTKSSHQLSYRVQSSLCRRTEWLSLWRSTTPAGVRTYQNCTDDTLEISDLYQRACLRSNVSNTNHAKSNGTNTRMPPCDAMARVGVQPRHRKLVVTTHLTPFRSCCSRHYPSWLLMLPLLGICQQSD
ncbi:hypothetical protein M3J09_006588 [Ascochyta lentis]